MDVPFSITMYLLALRTAFLAIVFSSCGLVWLNLSPRQGNSRVRAPLLACRSCPPHFRHSKFGLAAWWPVFCESVVCSCFACGTRWLFLLSRHRQSIFCCFLLLLIKSLLWIKICAPGNLRKRTAKRWERWETYAWLRLGNWKCQAVLVGVRTVLIQRLGCIVGSVWGNQHLCMQRQHSSQAFSTLGNTPNLYIGFLHRKIIYTV